MGICGSKLSQPAQQTINHSNTQIQANRHNSARTVTSSLSVKQRPAGFMQKGQRAHRIYLSDDHEHSMRHVKASRIPAGISFEQISEQSSDVSAVTNTSSASECGRRKAL